MRFRHVAVFGVLGAFACAAAAACIPELITDAAPAEAGTNPQGLHCGDGIITLGQYDGGFADLDAGEQCDPSGDAGITGCSADCRVECDGGFIDPLTEHCYFVAQPSESLNFDDNGAEGECRKLGGHAVTFVDDLERNRVIGALGGDLKIPDASVDASVFWLGLTFVGARGAYVPTTEVGEEPGWSPTCSGCYSAPNVDGSIPKLLVDASTACILDVPPFGWSQFPCTQIPTPIPVLCEREPPGNLAPQCNGGRCISIPSTAGKKRYLLAITNATAIEARNGCSDLGGSLVVFDTPTERETVLRAAVRALESDDAGALTKEAWIGYSTGDASTVFTWDLEGGMSESPWGDNQPILDASPPTRAYVTLDTNNYDVQLAHDDTDVPRPYICQY